MRRTGRASDLPPWRAVPVERRCPRPEEACHARIADLDSASLHAMTHATAILAALDARRVWDHCEALARLSEMEGGLTRVYLSPQQRDANALVMAWMREAGMAAQVDAMGNCVGRYEGIEA